MRIGSRFRVILLVAAAVFAAGNVHAQTSVGVILGEPTGLSAKMWIGERSSIDLAVAWSFIQNGSIYAHADYQQHFTFPDLGVDRLLFFVGLGPKFYVGDQLRIGLRIPLGAVYDFGDLPLEVFLELAPGILLFPETRIDGGGGIGIRYRLGE